jgi:recombination protein RecA
VAARSSINPAHEDAKAAALDAFLTAMNKEKPGEVLRLDDDSRVDIATVPTGAISLDLAIGAGGFPRGRIIELFGPESSGKTTLALSVAVNVQKMGGNVGFVDAEHALNRELCDNIGIDPRRFIVTQPDSGEEAIEMVVKMLASRAFDMIIVDSIAAMTPKAEIEADIEQQFMGLHSRLISRACRLWAAPTATTNTMLVAINQTRTQLSSYGAPETTTGGKALKFYSSLRIEVRSAASKKITRGTDIVGTTVTATVKKNKLGAPFKQAEYDVIFGRGIEGSGSLLDVCEKLGIVARAGASYTHVVTGERIAIGKEKAKEIIASNDDLREELTAAVYAALNTGHMVTASESATEASETDAA